MDTSYGAQLQTAEAKLAVAVVKCHILEAKLEAVTTDKVKLEAAMTDNANELKNIAEAYQKMNDEYLTHTHKTLTHEKERLAQIQAALGGDGGVVVGQQAQAGAHDSGPSHEPIGPL